MSSILSYKRKCAQCGGTGTYHPHGQEGVGEGMPCPWPGCDGNGEYEVAHTHLDEGVLFSYQLLEATDLSEFQALTDNQKEIYKAIMSLTIVDVSDGTQIRGWLMDMFGPGTTTRANMSALL